MNETGSKHELHLSRVDIAYVSLTFIVSVLSITGSVCILLVQAIHRDLRTFGRRMFAHLTVADLLTALGNILGVIWYLSINSMANKMPLCAIHSALTIMSSVASYLWTVAIAWFIFWKVLQAKPMSRSQERADSKLVLLLCWGVPIIVALVALFCNVLGYDHNLRWASWCWIDPTTPHAFIWMLATGKAWEMAACLLTSVFYTAVKILLFKKAKRRKFMMSKDAQSQQNQKLGEASIKLTFVPLAFFVVRIWGTVRFLLGSLHNSYANSSNAEWIVILQGVGDSAQGFVNFIFYCFFTSKVRKRLFSSNTCTFHNRPRSCRVNVISQVTSHTTNNRQIAASSLVALNTFHRRGHQKQAVTTTVQETRGKIDDTPQGTDSPTFRENPKPTSCSEFDTNWASQNTEINTENSTCIYRTISPVIQSEHVSPRQRPEPEISVLSDEKEQATLHM